MASFTEQATLLVVDKSSAKISKINRELNKLIASAQKLQKLSIKMNGLSKATSEVHKLNNEVSRVGRRPVNLRVQLSGAQQIRSQLNALARDRRVNVRGNVRQSILRGGGGSNSIFSASFANSVARFAAAVGIFQSGVALARETKQATLASESSQTRLAQAGFNQSEIDAFVEQAREVQQRLPKRSGVGFHHWSTWAAVVR